MKTHYMRAANVAASTIAISLALVSCGGPKGPNPPVKAAKPAPEFVAEVNKELVDIAREGNAAGWTQATNITVDTQYLNAKVTERFLEYFSRKASEAMAYDKANLDASTARALELIKLGVSAPAPSDAAKRAELAMLGTELEAMYGEGKYCKDPADRQTFCAAVQTPDKFLNLADMEKQAIEMGHPDRVLAESASFCGFDVAAVRTRLCNTAEQQEDLKFIASQCPAQGAALAQRHCAGRSYTSMSPKHRDFCASYAAANPQEQTPAGKAKGIFNMGKKALGGILGN